MITAGYWSAPLCGMFVRKEAKRRFKMALYKLGDVFPIVAPSAYIAPSAAVIGNAVLADRSSVWFGATLRGDNDIISIGINSNVQDGAGMHADPGFALMVGADVSVAPQAMMHGCN